MYVKFTACPRYYFLSKYTVFTHALHNYLNYPKNRVDVIEFTYKKLIVFEEKNCQMLEYDKIVNMYILLK